MARQKGDPDRRGMGAESDAISEQFVPDARYKARQQAMARTLVAAGLSPDQIANMLSVPLDSYHEKDANVDANVKDEKLKPADDPTPEG
jgi:hypothetical protein